MGCTGSKEASAAVDAGSPVKTKPAHGPHEDKAATEVAVTPAKDEGTEKAADRGGKDTDADNRPSEGEEVLTLDDAKPEAEAPGVTDSRGSVSPPVELKARQAILKVEATVASVAVKPEPPNATFSSSKDSAKDRPKAADADFEGPVKSRASGRGPQVASLAALSAVAEETGAQSGPPSVEPAKSDSTRIDESVAVSPETSHAAVVDAVAHRDASGPRSSGQATGPSTAAMGPSSADPWAALQSDYGASAVGKAEEEGIAATRSQGDSPGPMMMVDDETGDASVIASTAKGSQRGDTPPRGAQAPGKVRQGNWGQGELAKAGTVMTDAGTDEGASPEYVADADPSKEAAAAAAQELEMLDLDDVEDLDAMHAQGNHTGLNDDLAAKLAAFEADEEDE